jgi:hypothetical protein
MRAKKTGINNVKNFGVMDKYSQPQKKRLIINLKIKREFKMASQTESLARFRGYIRRMEKNSQVIQGHRGGGKSAIMLEAYL